MSFLSLRQTPPHVWLFFLLVLLFAGYYIRPDNVTEDSIKAVMGAFLGSLLPHQPAK